MNYSALVLVVGVALATAGLFYVLAFRTTASERGYFAFAFAVASVALLIPRPDLWPVTMVGLILSAFLASDSRNRGRKLTRGSGS